ncbi:MAG: D-tyrosyl-tRNA(Tyr) deacylase [Desulfovibrio sp.]|uniref:D-aminoacyl-tRNA deacylase n=1 Tax=Desulfovibrio sp. TaxID=885 RepID=UPI0025BDAF2F|nr:D-aminoacyl-tRNA deacylase [Desulfovibrio sp.]MBS6830970.1 D-tyrosyl-tRNA(Tyr) deacylase [Desulfovibrio sp.]
MRILVQRVREASVSVDGRVVAAISRGLLALVGFGRDDGPDFHQSPAFAGMVRKLLDLRIFPGQGDAARKFHCSLQDFGGQALLVPQFTLYADCRKGRRPSFTDAGDPAWAAAMFERFVRHVDESCHGSVSSGIFGAEMEVRLCNWGPVTIWLDSTRFFHNGGTPDPVPS